MSPLCSDEESFGPASLCRYMDFTLGFQYKILSITTSSIFLFCSLACSASLISLPRITRKPVDLLVAVKIVLAVALFASLAGTIALLPRDGWGYWATTAFSLEMVVAVAGIIPLSYLHHTRSLAPSTLFTCYNFVAALFAATQLRTYVNTSLKHESFFPPFLAAFACRSLLLGLELFQKRRYLKENSIPTAFEPTSSIPSRLLFLYLYPLLIGGLRKVYDLDELNDFGLPPHMSAELASSKLSKYLPSYSIRTTDGKLKQSIFLPSIRAFLVQFSAPAVPKLMLIALTFTQPYLVQTMLSFISSYTDAGATRQDPAHGWGLVGAYAIVYLGIAGCTSLYWDKVYTMVVCYRAALVGVIFDKSMRLSAAVAESKGGTAVTYMSVDVERVVEGIAFFHETWTSLVSVAAAAVILWFRASFAMIPPICIMVAFFLMTSYIGKRVAKSQKLWMGSTQSRIKVLSSILTQIIPIKLLAVESAVPKWVEPVRRQEVDHLRSFYQKLVIVAVLSQATVNFAGISSLGTFVGINSHGIEPETLFTILTIVNLLTLPISTIGNCFPLLLASYASMKRIAEFLSLDEKTIINHSDSRTVSNISQVEDVKIVDGSDVSSTSSITGAISLSNACVGVGEGEKKKLLISNCTVYFEPKVLSIIVGPVGAGKSILLKTLLDETNILSGLRKLPTGKVAYAPQEAFLWPTSVRENIVLDRPFDPRWYAIVVNACELEPDLERMQKGDMTIMSGTGGSVSGGQKQRISLARAVYANCEVTLLDDCFSALDSHTSVAVFSKLFGDEGLLNGKTVIMVTHNMQHLSTAGHIVILDDGSIIAQGTLSELHRSNLDIMRYVGEEKSDDAIDQVVEEGRKAEPGPGIKTSKVITPTKTIDEDANKSSTWAAYLFYLRACGWFRLGVCGGFLVVYVAVQIGLQILLKEWSESDSTNHGPWLGGYAAFIATSFTVSYIACFIFTQIIVPNACLSIHASQLDAVLNSPVSYFMQTPAEMQLNRWSSDMFIADFAFPRALQDFMFTFVYVLGGIILILIAVPWLAISVPFIAFLYWGLQRIYLATSRQLQRLSMSSKTPLYATFASTVSGIVTIRAFQSQNLFKEMNMHHLNRSQVPMYYRYAGIRFLRTALNFLTAFIAIAIAALAVGLRGSTSGGYLGVALSQLVGLAQSLINLFLAYTRVENGIVSIERIHELNNLRKDKSEDRNVTLPSGWPSRGSIEFRDVEMKYDEKSDLVLKRISFSVDGGEKIGICGRTGSGKSSTVFALLQGQALSSGSIYIDDVDISTVPMHVLRSAISTVSQTPFLLYATLRDNLTIGCDREVTDQEIWDGLDLVGMRKSVDSLPGKLEEMVSADGLTFSVGERQLLCITRVLLQRRKIIILDEASSSMDFSTDQRLLSVLKTSLKDLTVIAVAHRIATIVDYDKVMVLDDGNIVEFGSPKDLIEKEDSIFSSLYRNQQ